jgi:hypothetical protein
MFKKVFLLKLYSLYLRIIINQLKLNKMKTYENLLEDYQDLLSDINYLGNQDYSLDNESQIVYLNYMANAVRNLIDLNYKEEFNKI